MNYEYKVWNNALGNVPDKINDEKVWGDVLKWFKGMTALRCMSWDMKEER